MKDSRINLLQNGQSLALVALLAVVLFGLLALAIDGGMTYYKRRIAQAAADAGALAGAAYYCNPENESDPYLSQNSLDIAENYATRNGVPIANAAFENSKVAVRDTITHTTLFGSIIGQPEIKIDAYARAGCYAPGLGTGVLPVVWSCKPPVIGWNSQSEDCQQQRITWDTLQDYIDPAGVPDPPCDSTTQICPELYIVMDSQTYDDDMYCLEEYPFGTLQCDLDEDTEPDFLASGGRSWADLDGNLAINDCEHMSEGAQELTYWITNGYPCDIFPHTWISAQTGVAVNIFHTAEIRRQTNPVVLIPVYDAYCPDGDPRTAPACVSAGMWHPQDTINELTSAQPIYFHTIAFAAFYITCVNDVDIDKPGACPGIKRAVELNADLKENIKSIEGYFLEGPIPGLTGRSDSDIDTGIYNVYLDR